jgi:hypothetical protein
LSINYIMLDWTLWPLGPFRLWSIIITIYVVFGSHLEVMNE